MSHFLKNSPRCVVWQCHFFHNKNVDYPHPFQFCFRLPLLQAEKYLNCSNHLVSSGLSNMEFYLHLIVIHGNLCLIYVLTTIFQSSMIYKTVYFIYYSDMYTMYIYANNNKKYNECYTQPKVGLYVTSNLFYTQWSENSKKEN